MTRSKPKDRPVPAIQTMPPPPEPLVTPSQVIEIMEPVLAPLRAQLGDVHAKVTDIHALLMGVALPNGDVKGGMGQAFHDLDNHLTGIKATGDLLDEHQRKDLPELVAEAVANRLLRLYQEELRGFRDADAAMSERIEAVENRLNGHRI